MLSIDLFRNESDKIRADHDKRGLPHDRIDQVIDLDQQWRNALKDMEDGRRERNQAAKGIAEAKKSGNKEEADRIMAQVKDLGDRISALDEKANSLLEQRDSIECESLTFCIKQSQLAMMNQEILSIPYMVKSQNSLLSLELIMN